MSFDVFISYAWGSRSDQTHREWVRLLASNLHQIGFNIGIDAKVDYGSDLTGFMREIADSERVLMIVDENYVKRANANPNSGVATENQWIREVIDTKPDCWLGVLFVRNAQKQLPSWMNDKDRKHFDFNYDEDADRFPGSEQIDDLWRWIVGLPPDKTHAVSPAVIRQRMYRIERVDTLRDPANWSYPNLGGKNIVFSYRDAPYSSITLGQGSYEFKLSISDRGPSGVYVYADYLKAVGLINDDISDDELSAEKAYSYITPGRTVTPMTGQKVVLLNNNGCLCIIEIIKVQEEVNGSSYIPPQTVFDYRIITEETGTMQPG